MSSHWNYAEAQTLRNAATIYLSWCPGHAIGEDCPRQVIADALHRQAEEIDPPPGTKPALHTHEPSPEEDDDA